MNENIFIVNAWIVNDDGTLNTLDEYPKFFYSKDYNNSIPKAREYANKDFLEVWDKFRKEHSRLLKTVILETADGLQLNRKSKGRLQIVSSSITNSESENNLEQQDSEVMEYE